jgi:folate-binding protein YgfZ
MDAGPQVAAARQGALVVPRVELATLLVTGRDRVSWLNGLLTCDLVKRAPGAAVYGLAVGRSGRVLSDATVVFDDAGDRLLVAVPDGARADELRAHLDHYLVMEDAEVAAGAGFEAWAVHGPLAGEVLAAGVRAGALGGSLDATGLGGAIVLAPGDRSPEVAAAIAGGVRGAAIGDDAGWEALRLERGVPRFGADFGADTYPQEAGLERTAVSFDKGCYLGQEVVCMLERRPGDGRGRGPVRRGDERGALAHARAARRARDGQAGARRAGDRPASRRRTRGGGRAARVRVRRGGSP